jgi:hypothetical protein
MIHPTSTENHTQYQTKCNDKEQPGLPLEHYNSGRPVPWWWRRAGEDAVVEETDAVVEKVLP